MFGIYGTWCRGWMKYLFPGNSQSERTWPSPIPFALREISVKRARYFTEGGGKDDTESDDLPRPVYLQMGKVRKHSTSGVLIWPQLATSVSSPRVPRAFAQWCLPQCFDAFLSSYQQHRDNKAQVEFRMSLKCVRRSTFRALRTVQEGQTKCWPLISLCLLFRRRSSPRNRWARTASTWI